MPTAQPQRQPIRRGSSGRRALSQNLYYAIRRSSEREWVLRSSRLQANGEHIATIVSACDPRVPAADLLTVDGIRIFHRCRLVLRVDRLRLPSHHVPVIARTGHQLIPCSSVNSFTKFGGEIRSSPGALLVSQRIAIQRHASVSHQGEQSRRLRGSFALCFLVVAAEIFLEGNALQ